MYFAYANLISRWASRSHNIKAGKPKTQNIESKILLAKLFCLFFSIDVLSYPHPVSAVNVPSRYTSVHKTAKRENRIVDCTRHCVLKDSRPKSVSVTSSLYIVPNWWMVLLQSGKICIVSGSGPHNFFPFQFGCGGWGRNRLPRSWGRRVRSQSDLWWQGL